MLAGLPAVKRKEKRKGRTKESVQGVRGILPASATNWLKRAPDKRGRHHECTEARGKTPRIQLRRGSKKPEGTIESFASFRKTSRRQSSSVKVCYPEKKG